MSLSDTAFCGGTADIMKFFDQIPRELVYEMCRIAGMPSRILHTYKVYQEGLKVRNSLAGTLGKPYKQKASLPQGCPLSIMLVALYMRPWLSLMEEAGGDPAGSDDPEGCDTWLVAAA